MTANLLVTGGLGFIGSAFLRRLVNAGARPANVDIDSYAGDARRIEDIAGSIDTRLIDVASDGFVEAVGTIRPQAIVHLAAETHVTRSEKDAELFFHSNVEGTRRVLEAALAHSVERVVHVSTDEVYGPCLSEPFKESDKQPAEGLASSAYARSKALADDLALSYADRIEVVVVRPTNCFGPRQHPEKAIPRWTTRALRGERLPVWGDGGQIRDWMHVDDACEGIELLVTKGEPGRAYNLAPEGSQITNLEIAHSVARAVGAPEEAVYLTEYDRPDHDRRYAVDASSVRSLGWSPKLDLDARIAETVEWYRANRSWWEPLVPDAESIYDDESARETVG